MTEGQHAPPAALSVVVVLFAGRDYLSRCLTALASQTGLAAAPQVIVAHDPKVGDIRDLASLLPGCELVAGDPGSHPARLRSLAVTATRGSVIACTEDHCVPDANWCAAVLAAHAASAHAAIGGAVDKVGSDTALNWAAYLCDYGRYMLPLPEGAAEYLTDCNVSYKRAPLMAVRDTWAHEFHETTVNWALRARGESLWLSPLLVVRQQRSLRLAHVLRERFEHGRLFAATRAARNEGPSRLAYAAAALLLPPLLIGRVALGVLRRRRAIGALARALPSMLAVTVAWSAGELAGYLSGSRPRVVG